MSGYVTRLVCVVALVFSMSPPTLAQSDAATAEPDWVSLPRPAKPDRKNFETMAELLLAEFKLMRQAGLMTLSDLTLSSRLKSGLEIFYQARQMGATDTAGRLGEELEHYVDAVYEQIRSGRLASPEYSFEALALAASVYGEAGDTARAGRYTSQMKSLFGTCLNDEPMSDQLEAVAVYYANAENYRAYFTLLNDTFRSATDPCNTRTGMNSRMIHYNHYHRVVSNFALLLAIRGLVAPAMEALELFPVRGSKFDPLKFYDRYPVDSKGMIYTDTRTDWFIHSMDAFEERAETAAEIVFILAERGEPFEKIAPFIAIGFGETSRGYTKGMNLLLESYVTGDVEKDTRAGLDTMAAAMVRIGDVENGWRLVREGDRNYISDSASAAKLDEEKCKATWDFLLNIAQHGGAAIYDTLTARLAAEDKECSQNLMMRGNGPLDDRIVRTGMSVVNALSAQNSDELARSLDSYLDSLALPVADVPRIRALLLNTRNCRQALMRAQVSACVWNRSDQVDRFYERTVLLGWAAHYWAGSPPQISGTIFEPSYSATVSAAPVNLAEIYRY